MLKIKTLIVDKPQIISLAKFAVLLALAIAAPLSHQQLITGTIVNAVLFFAAGILGWPSAVAIGVLPSLFALTFGTLPKPLAVFIPFIITSNAFLILAFHYFYQQSLKIQSSVKSQALKLTGIVTASFLKFVFLFSFSQLIFSNLANTKPGQAILLTMSYPQLVTALFGGIIAFIALAIIKR